MYRCMYLFLLAHEVHLLSSFLSTPSQTATVSEPSQNEPTADSDELTDEVWTTLSVCVSDLCTYSMRVHFIMC